MWINRVNTAATRHAQVGQARRSERVSHNHYRPSKCHRTTLIQSLILRHDAAGITFLHLVSGGMGLKHHDSGDTVSLSPDAWRSLGGNRILILARSAEKLFSGCCWVTIITSCLSSHLFLGVSGDTGPLILLHTVGPEICQVLRAIPTSKQIHGLWERRKKNSVRERPGLAEQF